ncbi:MAG: GNAT family N-acetyltransferase [Gammaproteobacteria bacterium]|nr:GNAT family N-acetyltransferase [Gammaproteobacteria bacterium]
MPESKIKIKTGKDIVANDLTALRRSVNLTRHSTCAEIELSIDAYPFTAQARNATDELIGYVSAFSDGVFITMIGDLLVHADYQRRGIGTALLKSVERRYPGIPIQVHSLSDCLSFFTRQGYMPPEQPIRVVLKNITRANEAVIAWTKN